jgi:7 transmembrane receptor (rhodopsin family)
MDDYNETYLRSNELTLTTISLKQWSLYARPGISNIMIFMIVAFCVSLVVNVAGNSLLLVAIRTTPSLWTKTNKILANLAVADLLSGIATIFYMAYSLKVYEFSDPCNYNILETALMPLFKIPPYASFYSMVIVAIDRYVAVAYPLIYEEKLRDNVVYGMIAGVWIVSGVVSSLTWFWLINRDSVQCTTYPNLIPQSFTWLEVIQNMLIAGFITITFGRILHIARRHHVQIRSELTAQTLSMRASKLTERDAVANAIKSSNQNGTDTENAENIRKMAQQRDQSALQQQQQRDQSALQQQQQLQQKQQQRRREFRAIYLTGSLVGMFVILWMPRKAANLLLLSGSTEQFAFDLLNIGGAFGMFNSSFNWILYGLVNKTYRKAFRRLLSL